MARIPHEPRQSGPSGVGMFPAPTSVAAPAAADTRPVARMGSEVRWPVKGGRIVVRGPPICCELPAGGQRGRVYQFGDLRRQCVDTQHSAALTVRGLTTVRLVHYIRRSFAGSVIACLLNGCGMILHAMAGMDAGNRMVHLLVNVGNALAVFIFDETESGARGECKPKRGCQQAKQIEQSE